MDNTPLYKPTHTMAKFHASDKRIRIAIGPVGSSKTSSMCIEMIKVNESMPVCHDGIRRARWVVVRNTYPLLQTTTIKSWKRWFGDPRFGRFKNTSPALHTMDYIGSDGVRNLFEIYFVAIRDEKNADKILGLETTGFYFNELREIDEDIFRRSIERVGRYPGPLVPGGEHWRGIIADTNPPAEKSWLYNAIEKEKPELWDVFWQPPALILSSMGDYLPNPLAENVENLPGKYEYYFDMVRNAKNDESIRVSVLNQYGSLFSGRRCFPQYNPAVHRAPKTLQLSPDHEIAFGWDFGLDPSCIIAQFVRGRLLILEELLGKEMNLTDFMENVFWPFINGSRYKDHLDKGKYVSKGDPAGNARQDTSGYCIDLLNKAGVRTTACSSKDYNNIKKRIDSGAHFMSKMVDGKPAFELDPSCHMLHEGYKGGYHWRQVTIGGLKQDIEKPEKNEFSHSQDAAQAIYLHYAPNANTINENTIQPIYASPNWMAN